MEKYKDILLKLKSLSKATLIVLAAGATLLALVSVGISGYLLYKKGWDDERAKLVTKVLPFPALVVNGHPVTFAEYRDRGLDFTKEFYIETKGADYLNTGEGREKLAQKKRELLDILIEEEFVTQYSKGRGLSVAAGELDETYTSLVAENGGEEAFKRSLKEDYHWSVGYFKKVLTINLLKQKIEQSLCELESNEAKAVAEDVKSQLSAGAAFEELVSKYSEDPATAISGGRLPKFSSDGMTEDEQMMDRKIVEFAARANQGEIDIVKTCAGYSVSRLDIKSDDAREVSHILIKIKSYEDLLLEFRESSNILILLPDFYYSKNQAGVLPRK